MDLEIKIISQPERISVSTMMGLLSNVTKVIEKSVYETFCEITGPVSRRRVQKAIYGNIPIEIVDVRRGSFIIYLTGALAATIASTLYDVVKSKNRRRVTVQEVYDNVIPIYSEALLRDIDKEIKKKRKYGVLFVNSFESNLTEENGIFKLNIVLELGLDSDEKKHIPSTTVEQLEHVTEIINENRENSRNEN